MQLKIGWTLFSVYDMYDDIPEAARQPSQASSSSNASFSKISRPNIPLLAMIIGAVLLGVGAIALFLRPNVQPSAQPNAQQNLPSSAVTAAVSQAASPAASTNTADDTLLGHLPYSETPANELESITPDGQIKMRRAAAESYRRMTAAAAAGGVTLFTISGFRSIADQNDLFFRVKEERNQDVSKRAEVSAPPGHSEHHTGYAVDIGDGAQPGTNLSQSFEDTAAYRWLSEHAARYSFEMSFTKGNTQGVSYEPWHWRFVGDQNSLETFYRAQHLKPGSP